MRIKSLLATSALATTLIVGPAFAQQADDRGGLFGAIGRFFETLGDDKGKAEIKQDRDGRLEVRMEAEDDDTHGDDDDTHGDDDDTHGDDDDTHGGDDDDTGGHGGSGSGSGSHSGSGSGSKSGSGSGGRH